MKGVPMIYKEIPGFVSRCLVECYKRAVDQAEDGMTFVEVGSLFGKSTALMIELLREKKVSVDFYTIDLWQIDKFGPLSKKLQNEFGNKSAKEVFLDQMIKHDLINDVHVIEFDSANSASLFADGSVDFLFLDAQHSYEAVKRDALAWRDKAKIFAGHDYKPHNNLAKAIHECLPDHKIEYIEPRSFWSVKK